MLARSDRYDPAAQRVQEPVLCGGFLERICQMKNRMRDIRTSGSVRGEEGNLLAYSTSEETPGVRWTEARSADGDANDESEMENRKSY
jgi:hypothetical protein